MRDTLDWRHCPRQVRPGTTMPGGYWPPAGRRPRVPVARWAAPVRIARSPRSRELSSPRARAQARSLAHKGGGATRIATALTWLARSRSAGAAARNVALPPRHPAVAEEPVQAVLLEPSPDRRQGATLGSAPTSPRVRGVVSPRGYEPKSRRVYWALRATITIVVFHRARVALLSTRRCTKER